MKDLMYLEEKLERFRLIASELKLLKKEEMDLRKSLCDELLKNRPKGTHRFELPGMVIKANKKVLTTVDAKRLAEHYHVMTEAEKACIVYKPSLSLSAYNKLFDTPTLDECITVRPASPTLEVHLS